METNQFSKHTKRSSSKKRRSWLFSPFSRFSKRKTKKQPSKQKISETEHSEDTDDFDDIEFENVFCTRGLEHLLDGPPIEKITSQEFVLSEQTVQRQEGMMDDMLIAQIYQLATRDSQEKARRRALQDARESASYCARGK